MKSALLSDVLISCVLIVVALAIGIYVSYDPVDLYSDLQRATVRVDVGMGCGTGVLVTRKVGQTSRTFVWTAGHVAQVLMRDDGTFRNATIYSEERENGLWAGGKKAEARVIAYSDADIGEDLALLEVLDDNYSDVSAQFNSWKPLPVGTPLVHVGCTLGLYNSVSTGLVSQTDVDILKTGRVFDQTSCMGYPGSSGGGVYDQAGKCIGLLVRGAGPGINFVVPVRRIQAWATKMKLEWALDPSVPVHVWPSRDLKPATDTPFERKEPCNFLRRIIQRATGQPITLPLG